MRAYDRGAARAWSTSTPHRSTSPSNTPTPTSGQPDAELVDLLTPGHQGLVHRHGCRARLAGHPGARRRRLHRGDRRRPALPRRPHRADLRGHQRHPGHRPRGPQTRPCAAAPSIADFLARLDATDVALDAAGEPLASIRVNLAAAVATLRAATDYLSHADPDAALAGATPYLRMFGIVAGGWLMARQALAARRHLVAGAADTPSSKPSSSPPASTASSFSPNRPGCSPRSPPAAATCSPLTPSSSDRLSDHPVSSLAVIPPDAEGCVLSQARRGASRPKDALVRADLRSSSPRQAGLRRTRSAA